MSFIHILDKVITLAEGNTIPLESYSYNHTNFLIEKHLKKLRSLVLHKSNSYTDEKELLETKLIIGNDDLLVVVSPQRGSISYRPGYDTSLKRILKDNGEKGYLIIYPGMVSV